MTRRSLLAWLPLLFALPGCRWLHGEPGWDDKGYVVDEFGEYGAMSLVPNPLFIPGGDREVLWNAIVDELDDYFIIQREQRIHVVSNVLTEGQIDTRPQVGATLLEPWRADSANGYERTLATLQSIRRTARARVIPTEGGTLLDLTVLKELEHLERPAHATAGAMIARHDSSLVGEEVPPGTFTVTPGWISLGRDTALEQKILGNLKGRLCGPGDDGHHPLHHHFE
jgi:hypothetical protein